MNINNLASLIKLTINSDTGFVGLGVINPKSQLHVKDEIRLGTKGTYNSDVAIIADNYDSNGNLNSVNLNIKTEDTEEYSGNLNISTGDISNTGGTSGDITIRTGNVNNNSSSGDIVLDPGNVVGATSTGIVKLKKKASILNPYSNTVPFSVNNTLGGGTSTSKLYLDTSEPYYSGSILAITTNKWYDNSTDYDRYFSMSTKEFDSDTQTYFLEILLHIDNTDIRIIGGQYGLESAMNWLVPANCKFKISIRPLESNQFIINAYVREIKFGIDS